MPDTHPGSLPKTDGQTVHPIEPISRAIPLLSSDAYSAVAGSKPATPIAYDLSRLFLAPAAAAPRGIDRIDLALAAHVFGSDGSALGVLPTPWGVRVFDADTVRRGLASVRRLWAEDRDPEHDERWAALRQRIRGGQALPIATRLSVADKCLRVGTHLRQTGFSLGRSVRTHVPKGAVYVNVGQIGLAAPFLFDWLYRRQDVTAVLMLHDTIPLDHPDCVEPASRGHHARMIRTAARHGHGLVVTTRHARETVCAALARCSAPAMPVLARHLPLAEGFSKPVTPHPDLSNEWYFVVCGTVEPRKNQAMLLRLWKRLVARMGGQAPHLVLVGSHGYRSGEILAPLDQEGELAGRVHHVSGLSTPALAQLLAGSVALLVPSLNEGFGLPLVEARALGVPAIASDIPAHREVAGLEAKLLDPTDERVWESAIHSALEAHAAARPQAEKSLPAEVYCEDLLAFARAVAKARLPSQAKGSRPATSDAIAWPA